MKSILLIKKLLGLVEMMSGLVNANFNLPEWKAVKMIFFAPCCIMQLVSCVLLFSQFHRLDSTVQPTKFENLPFLCIQWISC